MNLLIGTTNLDSILIRVIFVAVLKYLLRF